MILVKPSFEILTEVDGEKILRNIERAGRTCYKSEDMITETSARTFVASIIKRGHESVIEHESVSVKLIVDRGVSHELVRHRIASFSQESTRYCNYNKKSFGKKLTFIIPGWVDIAEGEYKEDVWNEDYIWFNTCSFVEQKYFELLDIGWMPEQARSILSNSLKTEVVMTCNLREWRNIFKQRTPASAHPQMREVMIPMLAKFKELIPVIFDDITV